MNESTVNWKDELLDALLGDVDELEVRLSGEYRVLGRRWIWRWPFRVPAYTNFEWCSEWRRKECIIDDQEADLGSESWHIPRHVTVLTDCAVEIREPDGRVLFWHGVPDLLGGQNFKVAELRIAVDLPNEGQKRR